MNYKCSSVEDHVENNCVKYIKIVFDDNLFHMLKIVASSMNETSNLYLIMAIGYTMNMRA